MKIAIDARMYGLEHAGLGRYIINLINQIEKLDKNNWYYILLRKKYYKSLKFKSKQFRKVLADYPHYSFREQVFLPSKLNKLKPDLVHFPHFNVPFLWFGKNVVTIHDLIKHFSKGVNTTTRSRLFYWLKYYSYRLLVWSVVKKSTHIITPSNWWRKYLLKKYHLPNNKVLVTYEGADEFISKLKYINVDANIEKPYLLYVGNLYPHKNVERLVKAVKVLNRKQKINLVIGCPRNVFYQRFEEWIKELHYDSFVKLVGFLDNGKLKGFYKNAEAFVFPSLLEGFGLPGLEAMAMGTPVISSYASCLPEVYGSAVQYFNPHDYQDIANKIKSVLKSKTRQREMIKLGYQQIKKYSWQKMAKETLAIYEQAVKPA